MDVRFKQAILSVALMSFLIIFMAPQARSENVNIKTEDGRVLLYKQNLEGVYSNNWTGLKVSGSPTNQVDIHIRGEGKSVDFNGILSINCNSGSGFFWKTASNFDEALSESRLNETIPIDVIAKSKAIFCDNTHSSAGAGSDQLINKNDHITSTVIVENSSKDQSRLTRDAEVLKDLLETNGGSEASNGQAPSETALAAKIADEDEVMKDRIKELLVTNGGSESAESQPLSITSLPACPADLREVIEKCQGIWTSPTGKKYTGTFTKGHAEFRSEDGVSYTGAFIDGSINGDGVAEFPNKGAYKGGWKNGLMDGWGSYTDVNGHVSEGLYEKGKLVRSADIESATSDHSKNSGINTGSETNGQIYEKAKQLLETGDSPEILEAKTICSGPANYSRFNEYELRTNNAVLEGDPACQIIIARVEMSGNFSAPAVVEAIVPILIRSINANGWRDGTPYFWWAEYNLRRSLELNNNKKYFDESVAAWKTAIERGFHPVTFFEEQKFEWVYSKIKPIAD